jgi:hypothetical protein
VPSDAQQLDSKPSTSEKAGTCTIYEHKQQVLSASHLENSDHAFFSLVKLVDALTTIRTTAGSRGRQWDAALDRKGSFSSSSKHMPPNVPEEEFTPGSALI